MAQYERRGLVGELTVTHHSVSSMRVRVRSLLGPLAMPLLVPVEAPMTTAICQSKRDNLSPGTRLHLWLLHRKEPGGYGR